LAYRCLSSILYISSLNSKGVGPFIGPLKLHLFIRWSLILYSNRSLRDLYPVFCWHGKSTSVCSLKFCLVLLHHINERR
jgi:hypothetical protein